MVTGKQFLGVFWGLLAALPTVAATVDPAGVVPPHTLIRVRLDAGERAWILSSGFEPVDLERCGTELIVWTGPPGKYAVLTWTESSQGQIMVTIGNAPTPPPPDPDPPGPGPGPEPDPPPADIPNEYGIGSVAYAEAVKVGKPQEAAQLAEAAQAALEKLIRGATTPALAEAMIRAKRTQLSGNWSAWEQATEKAIAAAIKNHGSGALIYRSYFLEIQAALAAASKAKG